MSNHSVTMNRDDATKRVMLAIAIGPKAIKLQYTASDGTQPLVVTTPNEYVNDVIARVNALGGCANIALAEARKFTIFTIERDDSDVDVQEDNQLNKEMSMGMFWLKAQRKKGGTFRLKNSGAKIPALQQEFAYA